MTQRPFAQWGDDFKTTMCPGVKKTRRGNKYLFLLALSIKKMYLCSNKLNVLRFLDQKW